MEMGLMTIDVAALPKRLTLFEWLQCGVVVL